MKLADALLYGVIFAVRKKFFAHTVISIAPGMKPLMRSMGCLLYSANDRASQLSEHRQHHSRLKQWCVKITNFRSYRRVGCVNKVYLLAGIWRTSAELLIAVPEPRTRAALPDPQKAGGALGTVHKPSL